ncbi:cell wall-binding protein [Anaerococcus sp. mt242]|uniref:peptidoglycan amidohydrolase family protein n=1 Tax=Anaerococcus sp. mt242 TaxID=2661917 RepID=UPI0019339BD0|nr:peptidoglycan amidohydrolase family protein [Anaerococcus sp. mt242]MBM0046185.1 cell wall-binding protein [Anaerococcus sp. mt242]
MKKLNKTLLLASTLFVSTAVSTADKSYADEGYDLNVEPSKSTNLDNYETETDVNLEATNENPEINSNETINYDNQALTTDESIDQSQSLTPQENTTDLQDTDSKITEADFSVEKNEEENVEQEAPVQTPSSADVKEVIYYDDSNLDEALNTEYNEEKSQDITNTSNTEVKEEKQNDQNAQKEQSQAQAEDTQNQEKEQEQEQANPDEEESNLDQKNYYAPKGTGYFVHDGDSTKYYEDNKLVKGTNVIVKDKFYEIDKEGKATNPKTLWGRIGNNIYYMNEEGKLTKGIAQIKDKKYYFNKEGQLQRNKKIVTGQSYYELANDGSLTAPKNSWVTINKNKYYNDNNGKLLKGIAKIGDKSYYFDNKGTLTTNKKLVTSERYYEVDRNGVATNKKNKWFTIAGNTYRSDNNGKIVKGVQTINNNLYVFDGSGKLNLNKASIYAGKYYKSNAKGLATVVKNSWVNLNGKKYHTNGAGYVKEGVWKIDGNYYYFTKNGLTPNQTITQKGVVYTVDANGVATKEDNNIPGEKSIDKVMEWMFNARDKKMTYNMGAGRNSISQADCSSAVYRSLIHGGFLNKGTWVGNTETLFQMGAKGKVMYEVKENELQYGDIFVAGTPGGSIGAAGHTGFILNPKNDTIIHMTYGKNGVAVTPRKGYMGDSRGLPVKYFRLVGANSKGMYLNRK